MRKSKAWYRQVADSKANTNIYNRSVQFEDPLELWCPKALLAKVRNLKKLLLQIGKGRNYYFFLSSFLGCFLFTYNDDGDETLPKNKKLLKTIQRFCCE
jgi:hypothetical protein